jgi:hypothetical protein
LHCSRKITLAVSALALLTALPSARAGIPALEWLETPVARYLFQETDEGAALFSRLAGTDGAASAADFDAGLAAARARLEKPALAGFRDELGARLARIQEALGTPEDAENSSPAELSGEQKLFLREFAARELRLAPDWLTEGPLAPGRIEFVPEAPSSGAGGPAEARAAFAEGAPRDPAAPDASSEAPATPAERQGVAARVGKLLKDMRSCVESRPAAEAQAAGLRYTLTQLGIDEAMTVTGSVMASGITHMDWKSLPADMVFEAMSSTVGSRIMLRPGPMMVRWFRMEGFGLGQAGADAVLYYVTPLKDTHGVDVTDATVHRLEYNVGWNIAWSPIQVGMYELVTGLDCLYAGTKVTTFTTGLRFVAGLGSNFIYFRIRRHFIHSDD